MAKSQKKKPSASFAAKAAKQVNPSEEAVEAILPIWASQQDRKRLFYDSGFNDNLEMTDESYKEWMGNPLAREALAVDMDSSMETRFGFGIFSSGHGKDNPTYLYLYAHRGVAIIAGPEEISDKLKEQLKAAGAEYVAQSDKENCKERVNDFLANGAKKNWELKRDYRSPQDTIEILIHAFCACEDPPKKFLIGEGDDIMIGRGATVGGFIAEAGNPANVMCTIDLDKPKVPQKNIMNFEKAPTPAPAPQANAAAKPAPRPANT